MSVKTSILTSDVLCGDVVIFETELKATARRHVYAIKPSALKYGCAIEYSILPKPDGKYQTIVRLSREAQMPRYMRIEKFAADTGYTIKAVQRKIETGVWVEGVHYRRAPDGRILMCMEAFEAWVEGQSKRTAARSASRSASQASDTENR